MGFQFWIPPSSTKVSCNVPHFLFTTTGDILHVRQFSQKLLSSPVVIISCIIYVVIHHIWYKIHDGRQTLIRSVQFEVMGCAVGGGGYQHPGPLSTRLSLCLKSSHSFDDGLNSFWKETLYLLQLQMTMMRLDSWLGCLGTQVFGLIVSTFAWW